MLEFYKTAAGKAVNENMPLVMQKRTKEMQKSFKAMLPQLQYTQAEFEADMKSAAHVE